MVSSLVTGRVIPLKVTSSITGDRSSGTRTHDTAVKGRWLNQLAYAPNFMGAFICLYFRLYINSKVAVSVQSLLKKGYNMNTTCKGR